MRSTRNAVVTTLSERTPLLPGSSRRGQGSVHPGPPLGTAEELELPHIGPFVAAMRLEDIHRYTVDDLSPAILQARSYRAAFAICSLLYLRTYLKESFPRGRDIWVQWSQEKRGTNAARGVETLVKQVWAHFVSEEGSPEEVEQVLWTAFPLYPDSSLSVRVVDFLMKNDAPAHLVTHSLIQLSLLDTWKYGRSVDLTDGDAFSRIASLVDSNGTPRVLHFMDLLVLLVFLGMLCSYVVSPPFESEADIRGPLITVYALSRICRRWSSSTLPFGIILLCFVGFLPGTPPSTSFASLGSLVAFVWELLLLHLHIHPSPIFLLPPDRVLPLSTLVWQILSRTFVPVVAFFIPGLIISFFLLSATLYDNLFWHSTTSTTRTLALSMETRVLTLALFFLVIFFLCCTLSGALLVHPFLSPPDGSTPLSWDRYSKPIGLGARQAFIRVVAAYSSPYYFPAPLNILHILFVQLPIAVLGLCGRKTVPRGLSTMERALWRSTVAPIVFVLSTLWLWNLRTR